MAVRERVSASPARMRTRGCGQSKSGYPTSARRISVKRLAASWPWSQLLSRAVSTVTKPRPAPIVRGTVDVTVFPAYALTGVTGEGAVMETTPKSMATKKTPGASAEVVAAKETGPPG